MSNDNLYQLIYKLADRGLGKSLAGEGTQESRSVALLLSAVDNLSTAAELDSSLFQGVQRAIDELRMLIDTKSGHQGVKKEGGDPTIKEEGKKKPFEKGEKQPFKKGEKVEKEEEEDDEEEEEGGVESG